MRRNERISNKYYCEICRIWIENHSNNIRIHQEGSRHRYNQRKLLKSESYKEIKRKKEEEEIRKEFLKLHGITDCNDPKKTIKKVDKHKSVDYFRSNIFVPEDHQQILHDIDSTENKEFIHNKEMVAVGKWEEVKESESMFSSNIDVFTSNPFVNNESNVKIVKNHTLNNYIDLGEDDESNEIQSDLKPHQNTQFNQKIKISFNNRKTPLKIKKM